MTTVADLIAAVERHYPTATAESWDAVGLAVGTRSAPVRKILYTVDVTPDVVQEAVAVGADVILAHHPLFLRPVHSIDMDSPKGLVVAELIRHDLTLYVAHTNADIPPGGTVDALARALGLTDTQPLRPSAMPDLASPMADLDTVGRADTGLGRVGELAADLTLAQFADRVVSVLPRTGGGIRVSGPSDRVVRRVAVQAGAGDDLLEAAQVAGADVYLTSDLRHHPASEARARTDAPALIDVPHWAAESLWLPVAQQILSDDLAGHGFAVESAVSDLCTDVWNAHW